MRAFSEETEDKNVSYICHERAETSQSNARANKIVFTLLVKFNTLILLAIWDFLVSNHCL